MQLIDFLSSHGLTDAAFAERVGGVGRHGVHKWKYRQRVPSARQIARIAAVTDGAVVFEDWIERPTELAATPSGAAA